MHLNILNSLDCQTNLKGYLQPTAGIAYYPRSESTKSRSTKDFALISFVVHVLTGTGKGLLETESSNDFQYDALSKLSSMNFFALEASKF